MFGFKERRSTFRDRLRKTVDAAVMAECDELTMRGQIDRFEELLDEHDITYRRIEDEDIYLIGFRCETAKHIMARVIFDEDHRSALLSADVFLHVPVEKRLEGLEAVNEVNRIYRNVTGYIDGDFDIDLEAGVEYLDGDNTFAEECVRRLGCLVSVADDAYPQLAKAVWA